MNYAKAILIIVLAVAGGLFLWSVSVRSASGAALPTASSSPSPSATPSVEPTATPTPCPWPVVKRVQRARQEAVIAWARSAEVRNCFDRPPRAHPPRLPKRSASEAVWRARLKTLRSLAGQYKAERKMLRHKMRNPGQPVNGERWRPLALYVGWTRAEWPTVLYIMAKRGGTGESGGWPLAYNSSSGCAGLMQLHPGFYTGQWAIRGIKEVFNWRDPEVNLRKALGIKQDAHGFGPWAYQ